MTIAEILFLVALIVFIVGAVLTYGRSRSVAWTDIGLAFVTAAFLMGIY